MHILHLCDTRACINPLHLRVGTNTDNIMDSVRKGRRLGVKRNRPTGLKYNVPPGAHDCKLKIPRSDWISVAARWLTGEPFRVIAETYGVSETTVLKTVKRLKDERSARLLGF
jgi:hypothetical protein